MAGEFVKDSLENLINSISVKSSGSFDDIRYGNLEPSKDSLTKLTDKDRNVVDIIKNTELIGIFKKINALDNVIDAFQKQTTAEGIVNNLFDIISDLNTDLLMADEASPEYQNILQSLAVAFYMYEQVLYPVVKEVVENNVSTNDEEQSTSEWIADKTSEIEDLKIRIETQLFLEGISKTERHSKDKFIESEFNNGIKNILIDLEKRKRSLSGDAQELDNFKIFISAERKKFFTEWNVSPDENEETLNVSKMTLREIADYVLRKELPFWTGEHDNWTDENDRKVVDALIQRLWKDNHKIVGLTNDFIPDPSNEKVPDPKENGLRFSDLEFREIVSDLQILGLFGIMNVKGKERKDDGAAEGLLPELEACLSKLQMNNKELLNLTTFAHPRTGMILYEFLRRMKDQGALRKGEIPKLKRGEVPTGFGRAPMNDRLVMRNGQKVLLFGDRFIKELKENGEGMDDKFYEGTPLESGDVLILDYSGTEVDPETRMPDGKIRKPDGSEWKEINDRVVKRDNKDTLLVGDRLVKIVNGKGVEIGKKWYDYEPKDTTDMPLYEFDERFCYETLAADSGKARLRLYAADLASKLEDQRLEIKAAEIAGEEPDQSRIHFKELIGYQLPDPNDKQFGERDVERLKMYSRYLFFSFPFLTNILAMRQERTCTPAHGFANKDIQFTWIFDILGFIVHKSQRYGNSDTAFYYLLKFFPPLQEGHYGAGGDVRRLNQIRDLIIKYDKIFDDRAGESLFPKLPYGSSYFHTALSMLAMAPGEHTRLMGKAKLADGRILEGTQEKPVLLALGGEEKKNEKFKSPYNFSNIYTSIRAWDKFITDIAKDLPPKLNIQDIAGGGGKEKSLISQRYGDDVGQAKMSSTKTLEKDKDPNLADFDHLTMSAVFMWDTVKRLFRQFQSNSVEVRKNLYKEMEKGFIETASRGGLSEGSAATVLKYVLARMSSPDKNGKFYAKDRSFAGMNPCLDALEPTVKSINAQRVFEYVEALWNYQHSDVNGNVVKLFPFKLANAGSLGSGILNRPLINVRQALNADPDITKYQGYLLGYEEINGKRRRVELPEPIKRINLEKHDD